MPEPDEIQSAAFGSENLKPSLTEIGTSGLKRYGGQIQEEFLPELRGLRGVRVYTEMRNNDPTVGGMIRATKDCLLSVEWTVEPKGDQQVDQDAVEFLESCMNDMAHSWRDMINEASTMVPYGWAYMEVVYKLRLGEEPDAVDQWGEQLPTSKYDDNKIGWRKIVLRGQETLYRWDIDQHGGIKAMEQYDPVTGGGIRRIPIEHALLFRTDREKNNPEGLSFLRWAYRAWYMKKQLEEMEAIGAERDLTGLPIIHLPQGATTAMQQKALDILQKLKTDENSGLILDKGPSPDGRMDWEFELVNSPGSKSLVLDTTIKRYQAEIGLAFLAQFLQLGSNGSGGGGSHALAREHKDFFYVTISSLLDSMEETINRFLVPKLFKFNAFPGLEQLPEIKHGKVGQRELTVFINAVKALADAGLMGPVDSDLLQFLRSTLDLPEISQEQVDLMNAREQALAQEHVQDPAAVPVFGGGHPEEVISPQRKADMETEQAKQQAENSAKIAAKNPPPARPAPKRKLSERLRDWTR